jgi:hypothetical protein
VESFANVIASSQIGWTSPFPISIGCHLLTTEDLNPEEHQIILRKIGDYAADVVFHHVHIPILLKNKSSD